ncbi:hypothetical protein [Flavobacterium fluviale]|uniref:Uncharacterized protein n=1 Tax=Flavobacterium fluviale TaxID=2249356 RepID=A0A344LNM7_9FLAO|nr:hypothetical protein [Flavobacterium fluviale]AXB55519.1 hypothetical protein HYN86_02440 [Flavobacterium fluviale]
MDLKLPEPAKFSLEDNSLSLMLNVLSEGNKIQFSFSKDINNSIFAAEDYDALKTLFQKMIVSQNKKIVLKKA